MIIGSDKVVLRVCISSFGACRMLFDVSCIHFPETVLCQLKHILGLANRRAHVAKAKFRVSTTSQWFSYSRIEGIFG